MKGRRVSSYVKGFRSPGKPLDMVKTMCFHCSIHARTMGEAVASARACKYAPLSQGVGWRSEMFSGEDVHDYSQRILSIDR